MSSVTPIVTLVFQEVHANIRRYAHKGWLKDGSEDKFIYGEQKKFYKMRNVGSCSIKAALQLRFFTDRLTIILKKCEVNT